MVVENVVANHLSRLENKKVTKKEINITEDFPNVHLMKISE